MGDGPDGRTLPRAVYAAAALLFVPIAASIAAYARLGGPFVDGLDDRIGEVVATRAAGLARAGLNERAVAQYRVALALPFDDEPMQRIWTTQRYAKLLLESDRPGEAAGVLEAAFALRPAHAPCYMLLFDALCEDGRTDRALAIGRAHAAAARAAGDAAAEQWAYYREGSVYRDAGQLEPAAAAFAMSYAIKPTQENAWQTASTLQRLGRRAEAKPYLDYVLEHGDAKFRALATGVQE